jgi:hypothetical protein
VVDDRDEAAGRAPAPPNSAARAEALERDLERERQSADALEQDLARARSETQQLRREIAARERADAEERKRSRKTTKRHKRQRGEPPRDACSPPPAAAPSEVESEAARYHRRDLIRVILLLVSGVAVTLLLLLGVEYYRDLYGSGPVRSAWFARLASGAEVLHLVSENEQESPRYRLDVVDLSSGRRLRRLRLGDDYPRCTVATRAPERPAQPHAGLLFCIWARSRLDLRDVETFEPRVSPALGSLTMSPATQQQCPLDGLRLAGDRLIGQPAGQALTFIQPAFLRELVAGGVVIVHQPSGLSRRLGLTAVSPSGAKRWEVLDEWGEVSAARATGELLVVVIGDPGNYAIGIGARDGRVRWRYAI